MEERLTATSDTPYKIQVTLDPKYKSLIVRGRPIHDQPAKSTFPEKRKAGNNNLDLWLDGSSYPMDPLTRKRPHFHDVKSLLEYVGDGEKGMLGYMTRLQDSGGDLTSVFIIEQSRSQSEIASLKEALQLCRQQEQQCLSRQMVERESLLAEIQEWKKRHVDVQSSSEKVITSFRVELEQATTDLQESILAEVEREKEIVELERYHVIHTRNLEQSSCTELERVKLELATTTKNLSGLERKWKQLQITPYGYRKQQRIRRDIHSLSQSGSHAKAQRRLAHSIVAPATVTQIQKGNAANCTKQRLCGSKEAQIESGKVFASILSKTEVSAILHMPAMESVGTDIANHYLDKISAEIGAHEILEIEDRSGITNEAYNNIYKKFKGGAKAVGKGLRIGCLPKPYHVSLLRKEMNNKLRDFVGDYYSIHNTLEILPGPKSKKKEPMQIELNENNSLFIDVETI